ncbi:hypothetical protein U3A58_21095 [Algoriphagus sp. C2-6-M1]|uniref:hypothetical protein n=1 Tax=Algoriphagus persicinus TaxID=3108754 RepID=UPI002B36867A|nr:hypothetical protein [Algoriphagus sp. C2-6-M1]MEB2782890.1 hypothetical protein [Algoriphagus sp. C2-6-M1]
MKKTYLIQTSIKENEAFNDRIKSLGTWLKYFSDNWIVESTFSSKEIYDKLSSGHDKESIFIIELNVQNYWGRMNTTVWEYLKERKK